MRKSAHRQAKTVGAWSPPSERKKKQIIRKISMLRTFVAISLGAVIGFSPLAAVAQSEGPAQPEQVAQAAPAATGTAHAAGGGSHRRHLRHRGNQSRERARASAEHMRQMRMAPAAPHS
jgi:hypothetical protein